MMQGSQEERPWATRTARNATIALLVLQLAGCAVDMVEPQATLLALFCMASVPDSQIIEWAGLVIWLMLAFSWVVGAAALKISSLRPIYWGLLLCIPLAFTTQQVMLNNEALFCDAP